MTTHKGPLTPAQQRALESLERHLGAGRSAMFNVRSGSGRTTVLHALQARLGKRATVITPRDFIEASAKQHPLALEETVHTVLMRSLDENDVVLVDDFQLVAMPMVNHHMYPRLNYLGAAIVPVLQAAERDGKTLVIACEGCGIYGVMQRVEHVHIDKFEPEDFGVLVSTWLGDAQGAKVDVRKIHRFAPNLTARHLRRACEALRNDRQLDTDRFVEYLREHQLISNVQVDEVQAVDLQDLKGLDDVLDALEANVILPLENTAVAEELRLTAKRGVLLAGPPGTGKTTIGRALARRLKSKFFLIDGTVVTGTPDFFGRIHRIFEAAKQNAPGIIFIDDSDVIFENTQETGLYRYLLTMLDGLESKSAGRICLMMTAMDVGNLPPALVRSGRIELWLETRLPDPQARAAILRDRASEIPAAIGPIDLDQLAEASEGLTGADLKRVVEDGKLLFAFDRARTGTTRPATEYFLEAIETVRRNKQQYAEAEMRGRMQGRRPHMHGGVSVMGEVMSSIAFGASGAPPEEFGHLMPPFGMMRREIEEG